MGKEGLSWTDRQPDKWTPGKWTYTPTARGVLTYSQTPGRRTDGHPSRQTPRGWDAPRTDREPREVHPTTDNPTAPPSKGQMDGCPMEGRRCPESARLGPRLRPGRAPQHPEGAGSESGAGKGGTSVASGGGEWGDSSAGPPRGGNVVLDAAPRIWRGALSPRTPSPLGPSPSWGPLLHGTLFLPLHLPGTPTPLGSVFILLDSPPCCGPS